MFILFTFILHLVNQSFAIFLNNGLGLKQTNKKYYNLFVQIYFMSHIKKIKIKSHTGLK